MLLRTSQCGSFLPLWGPSDAYRVLHASSGLSGAGDLAASTSTYSSMVSSILFSLSTIFSFSFLVHSGDSGVSTTPFVAKNYPTFPGSMGSSSTSRGFRGLISDSSKCSAFIVVDAVSSSNDKVTSAVDKVSFISGPGSWLTYSAVSLGELFTFTSPCTDSLVFVYLSSESSLMEMRQV